MTLAKKIIALALAALLTLSVGLAAHASESWDKARLNSYLGELADKTKDPWLQAIYRAGAENLTIEGDVLTFNLCGFAPDMKSLPKRADDPDDWHIAFFEGMEAHNLQASLTLKEGEPTKGSQTKLDSLARNAANKAKGLFSQQTVKTAITDILFPTPYKDQAALKERQMTNIFVRWANRLNIDERYHKHYSALLRAQGTPQLNVSKGPHAIEISVKYLDPQLIIDSAQKLGMDVISRVNKANATPEDELISFFGNALLDVLPKLSQKAQGKKVFTVDLYGLSRYGGDEGYAGFVEAFNVQEAFSDFEARVRELPDYAAQEYPKNGRISGSTSGTKLNVKAPNDDLARYCQLRRADSDDLLVEFFIRPHGTATIRAYQGEAYLLIAAGNAWYGTEGLFGDEGMLSRSQDFEILPSNYYHNITLGVSDGNLNTLYADPDMFNKR